MTDRIRNHDHHDLGLAEIVGWKPPTRLTVPAYGVVRLSAFADGIFTTVKPDGAEGIYYVNGPVDTPQNAYSSSLMWIRAQPVLFKTGVSVEIGDACGPVEDEWFMSDEGSGWRIFIEPNSDNIAFVLKEGGGAGGAEQMAFTITAADCDYGYVTTHVDSIHRYTGCNEPPGVGYGETYEIQDFFGFLTDLEDVDVVGAKAMAIYWNDYPGCDAHWELIMIEYRGDCP
ncbi:MAG: hypothetical protein GY759_11510 [Chloroflexi bacterium]|nr:hypothetical protein [Chloroflexota bacterium]